MHFSQQVHLNYQLFFLLVGVNCQHLLQCLQDYRNAFHISWGDGAGGDGLCQRHPYPPVVWLQIGPCEFSPTPVKPGAALVGTGPPCTCLRASLCTWKLMGTEGALARATQDACPQGVSHRTVLLPFLGSFCFRS